MLGHRGRHSIPSARLIRVLSRLIDCYGPPDAIRLDNGPEMISDAFTEWAVAKGISIRYIQPGKPNQNAFIERFNRTYRTEELDAHLFANLEQVQAITERWLVDYNEYRPHESLGGLPPAHFMPRFTLAPIVYTPMSTRQGCLRNKRAARWDRCRRRPTTIFTRDATSYSPNPNAGLAVHSTTQQPPTAMQIGF